jgi:hypothetical protein
VVHETFGNFSPFVIHVNKLRVYIRRKTEYNRRLGGKIRWGKKRPPREKSRRGVEKSYREFRISQPVPKKPEEFYPETEDAFQETHLFFVKPDKREFAERSGVTFRKNKAWISTQASRRSARHGRK